MEAILKTEGLQFIWLVLSAFPLGKRIEVPHEPCADGNPRYWAEPELRPQLAGANFEIVSWDSSATLLVGVPEKFGNAFMNYFPQAKLHSAVVRGEA